MGDPEVARDVVAEAFAQGIARGDSIQNPSAWVWKAALMIARGELADQRGAGGEPEVTAVGVSADEVMDLLAGLRTLSPLQRASIVLHHYAGYPVKDVADMLATTRSAVGVHLFRGRNRLRRELGGDRDA